MGNTPFLWKAPIARDNKVKGKSDGGRRSGCSRNESAPPGRRPELRIRKQSQGLFAGTGQDHDQATSRFSVRQLATMLAAGIPLVQSFEIVGNGHENAAMQKLILNDQGRRRGWYLAG